MAPSKKKPVPTPRPKSDNDAIAESIPDEIAMPSAAAGVDSGDSDAERIHTAQIAGNRKKRGGSGGFQSMGLSYPVYNAVIKKGYKVPTPIQRKSVPLIMSGRDVVAMARTGSGKTAAFTIPMIERLKSHSARVGARAVVLSPSRELALQTMKVVKELARYTDLRTAMIVGGDRIEDQFTQLATNPDIVVATPGRLLHVMMEMGMDLKSLEYLVFDEADRLFELGFSDAIDEILHKCSADRQTHLFSATLPKTIVEFAKAGLHDPVLVRLDVDSKISPDLELAFFTVKPSDKEAALIYLLRTVIDSTHQSIVFASTKHHVEYLHELLIAAGMDNAYVYGALDQAARKLNLERFREGKVKVMVVTDVAARGIDIPLLNNVIHYDFADRSKLFVHRAGRAARAGRMGTSYAMVTPEELPYLIDLQLFLGRPMLLAGDLTSEPDLKTEVVLGDLPAALLEDDLERVQSMIDARHNLAALRKVSQNGYKLFSRTRHAAAKESHTRSRALIEESPVGSSRLGVHPVFAKFVGEAEKERVDLLDQLRNFRPAETIFEFKKMGLSKASSETDATMKARRAQLDGTIARRKEKKATAIVRSSAASRDTNASSTVIADADEEDIDAAFGTVFGKKRARPTSFRDEEFYIPHTQPSNDGTETAYAVNTGAAAEFLRQASSAEMGMTGDDARDLANAKRAAMGSMKWDSKKRRYIRETLGRDNKKLIRTDSGAMLPASYKTNIYQQWQKRTKLDVPRVGDQESSTVSSTATALIGRGGGRPFRHTKQTQAKPLDKLAVDYERKLSKLKKREADGGSSVASALAAGRGTSNVRSELKTAERIQKERKTKEKRRQKNARPSRKVGGGKPSSKGKGGGRR